MRYIGGKSLLIKNILEVIEGKNITRVIDIFSGTAVVANTFKSRGFSVIANDFLYFCYILARGSMGISHKLKFKKLGFEPLAYLNQLTLAKTDIPLEKCFIYSNYSPNINCLRMYFQNNNAIKIDIIRITIEAWLKQGLITEDEYFYLLACLLNAIPFIANITGVYAAYLKFWDKRSFYPLKLEKIPIIESDKSMYCYNRDYSCILNTEWDLLYADPPYNTREYLPNYHILETIARYDTPAITGISGMRNYDQQKSSFCKKTLALSAFEKLVRDCKCKYLVISYNNEGIVKTRDLIDLCTSYAQPETFRLFEFDYKRYKNKIPNNKPGLKEQLYLLQRHPS